MQQQYKPYQFKPIYRGRGKSVWLPAYLHAELKAIARLADQQENPADFLQQLMAIALQQEVNHASQ